MQAGFGFLGSQPSGSLFSWSLLLTLKNSWLGPPVVPLYPFFGEGSPAKIDYRKKGTLILTSLQEDLVGH